MLPGLAPSLSDYFYKDRGADKKQLECRPSMVARVRGGGGSWGLKKEMEYPILAVSWNGVFLKILLGRE